MTESNSDQVGREGVGARMSAEPAPPSSERRQGRDHTSQPGRQPNAPLRPVTPERLVGQPRACRSAAHAHATPAPCCVGLKVSAVVALSCDGGGNLGVSGAEVGEVSGLGMLRRISRSASGLGYRRRLVEV